MKAPRDWKSLERHPLSSEYADLTGRAWSLHVENLKLHGIIGGRKIILHEGKVIDGWQLHRACIEAEITPQFEKLKLNGKLTAEEYVATVNDLRRHESQEQAVRRVEERRNRVVAARRDGQSLRTIANDEGVSEKTVRDDLENTGAEGYAPDTVRGQDGKTYSASRLAKAESEPTIPERLKPIFDDVPLFEKAVRDAERLANIFQEIEQTPAYRKAVEGKKHRENSTLIRAAGRAIQSMTPKRPCCTCGGEYEPSLDNDPCTTCGDKGYQTVEEVHE